MTEIKKLIESNKKVEYKVHLTTDELQEVSKDKQAFDYYIKAYFK